MKESNELKRWRKRCAWVIDTIRQRPKSDKALQNDFGGFTSFHESSGTPVIENKPSKLHILYALHNKIRKMNENNNRRP